MKTIAGVNIDIPGINNYVTYDSGQSLADFDIVIFNPDLPYYDRQRYSDGSSSIDRVSGAQATKSISHWNSEITNALKEGKTVFFLLAEHVDDTYVTGISSSKPRLTTYSSSNLSNYEVTPFSINVINSEGTKIKVTDRRFTDLFSTLNDYIQYKAYLNIECKTPIATTSNGSRILGAIYRLKGFTGNLVLLPYFDLDLDSLTETNKKGEENWSKLALGLGTKLISNLIELDKVLIQQPDLSPQPDWVKEISKSKHVGNIEDEIVSINQDIKNLEINKNAKEEELRGALLPSALLYETGKPLENAIEFVLKQLGYNVENFREDALEIDHIIISPEGKRFIGETEGKDNTAVNIEKFRQLESNINEDYQQDQVTEPASSILFGNGYRLKEPSSRECQFTDKCLTNAKRLSTVLVQTSDLFPIAMYLQDYPNDETFKIECRKVLESSGGGIVNFHSIPKKQ